MRAIIGRVVAVLAGAIITFLTGTLGLPVSDAAAGYLTEALTALGMGVWLIAYAVVHKLINRKINPGDTAAPATVSPFLRG